MLDRKVNRALMVHPSIFAQGSSQDNYYPVVAFLSFLSMTDGKSCYRNIRLKHVGGTIATAYWGESANRPCSHEEIFVTLEDTL